MLPTRQGSFRLFRFAGIDVFLHWSWFILVFYELSTRSRYSSPFWIVLEVVTLFAIVLMHEFGHALACRQTGGKAEQIVLWPLGGVAYVAPPSRPGATLWSIAAGPLVNVILVPVLFGAILVGRQLGLTDTFPRLLHFLSWISTLNLVMLIFNLLPIYPLDGGQILRSILWFFMGPFRSLMAASIVGMAGVVVLIGLAVWIPSMWLGILAVFILANCWGALTRARSYARLASLPRRYGYACPECGKSPVLAPIWRCAKCLQNFDAFATEAVCPKCGERSPATTCVDCGTSHPIEQWEQPPRYQG